MGNIIFLIVVVVICYYLIREIIRSMNFTKQRNKDVLNLQNKYHLFLHDELIIELNNQKIEYSILKLKDEDCLVVGETKVLFRFSHDNQIFEIV